jgi:hypothetical protein
MNIVLKYATVRRPLLKLLPQGAQDWIIGFNFKKHLLKGSYIFRSSVLWKDYTYICTFIWFLFIYLFIYQPTKCKIQSHMLTKHT